MKTDELTPEQIKAIVHEYGQTNGKQGQAKMRRRFLVEVDRENPGLPEDERQAQAEIRFRRHMTALAHKRHGNA